MTKNLYNTLGRIYFKIRIYYKNRQKVINSSAISDDVRGKIDNLVRRAVLDAVHKYFYTQEGINLNYDTKEYKQYDTKYELLDYDVQYSKFVNIKRINKYGKYYTTIRDNNNKLLHTYKWKNEEQLERFDINTYGDVI